MGIATALTLNWFLPTLVVLLVCGSLSLDWSSLGWKKRWNMLTRIFSLHGVCAGPVLASYKNISLI